MGYIQERYPYLHEEYKKDLMSSDVILDMSHLKWVSNTLYNIELKRNIAVYLIGNCWTEPTPKFNIVVNSAKQLDMGIKGETGFEGTPWQYQNDYSGILPKTSKYCHLGVNTDFYQFEEEKDDYFLWLARFHPAKGPDVAIQLAIETGIKLVMAGDMVSHPEHWKCGQACIEMIKGHDNIKIVQLPQDETHQRAKMKLMQKAKCYLFPVQFHESFGLTTVEALSCGTPVIATNMGALPEIIFHGETGFIAQDYSHMKTFINSIDTIKPRDCRKDVEKRFSREAMAKRFEAILLSLYNGEQW